MVGGRLTGTASDVQFSFNFITKPNDDVVEYFSLLLAAVCLLQSLARKINLMADTRGST
jgi:hypothetical protein